MGAPLDSAIPEDDYTVQARVLPMLLPRATWARTCGLNMKDTICLLNNEHLTRDINRRWIYKQKHQQMDTSFHLLQGGWSSKRLLKKPVSQRSSKSSESYIYICLFTKRMQSPNVISCGVCKSWGLPPSGLLFSWGSCHWHHDIGLVDWKIKGSIYFFAHGNPKKFKRR